MSEPIAYLNGAIMPQSRAGLPLHDSGFVLGVTVTDLARTFSGRIYRWEDHLARFRASCRAAHITVALDDAKLTSFTQHIMAYNHALVPPGGELCVVLFATPGPIGYYVGKQGGAGDDDASLGIYTYPLPFARLSPLVRQGAYLVTPSSRQISATIIDPSIKHRSRMHYWLAEHEAHRLAPGAGALLLDENGHVTETPNANFLIVRDDVIHTPRQGRVLAGISLGILRELAGELAIPVEERDLTLDDCYQASEAILTNTSYCLASVRQLNEHPYAAPGPMAQRLAAAWSAKVGTPIHQGF